MFKLRMSMQYIVFDQTLRRIVWKFGDTSLKVRRETPKNVQETFKMCRY